MKTTLTLAAWLLAAAAWGASVSLPATVQAKRGRLNRIVATTDAKSVGWINGNPDAADLIPWPTGTEALFMADTPGRYFVWAYTANADGTPGPAALCVVNVEGPTPGPAPTPGPGPGPPPPPPPAPGDPLTAKLSVAWGLETDPNRVQQKAALASVYRQAAGIAQANTGLTTWGELFDALATVAKINAVNGKLLELQKVLQLKFQAELPNKANAPLDAAGKALAGRVFSEAATALEGVK